MFWIFSSVFVFPSGGLLLCLYHRAFSVCFSAEGVIDSNMEYTLSVNIFWWLLIILSNQAK